MRSYRWSSVVPSLVAVALVGAQLATASTLTVTNTNDSGAGSLRAAIAAAASGDTINFNLTYPATITLASPLQILTSVAISGPGASNLAISGNHSNLVMEVGYIYLALSVSLTGI